MCDKSKENNLKVEKITLKGYYNGLAEISPRMRFKREIMKLTGVTEPTIINWVNGAKPHKYEHVIALSKVTGIKPSELWEK